MSDAGEALPDVLGLELEEAQEKIAAEGWQVIEAREVRAPDGAEELLGPRRVVRVRAVGEKAVVLDYVATRQVPA
ncbi:MAG: hypothetical protein J7M26_03180 [Armatimonadetes bacterium]|nr:hypothetical protein [Armatimonadota bacterium]